VNARQAAPIIIATGNPVMALGGFSGGDPILTVDDFARLVAEHRVRFALIGDGSEGIRRVFGEARQKPLTDWIQANGKRVDAARWRTPVPVEDPGAANGRPLRAAERRRRSALRFAPGRRREGLTKRRHAEGSQVAATAVSGWSWSVVGQSHHQRPGTQTHPPCRWVQ
jgi:hypothetical protein